MLLLCLKSQNRAVLIICSLNMPAICVLNSDELQALPDQQSLFNDIILTFLESFLKHGSNVLSNFYWNTSMAAIDDLMAALSSNAELRQAMTNATSSDDAAKVAAAAY